VQAATPGGGGGGRASSSLSLETGLVGSGSGLVGSGAVEGGLGSGSGMVGLGAVAGGLGSGEGLRCRFSGSVSEPVGSGSQAGSQPGPGWGGGAKFRSHSMRDCSKDRRSAGVRDATWWNKARVVASAT
jgi:hypothetical protein